MDLMSDSADSEDRMATTLQLPVMPPFSVTALLEMGERFGILFRGVKHFGQEIKTCCTAAFSGA